ncbi:MAG: hypothetical protein GDA46_06645 [Bdellovibrionales bacterium]|nr:hypothetical protein [Bdellovibrionales bacterium]
MSFQKKFFGKWVLAGEYSVLRKGFAIVYPLNSYSIGFKYSESKRNLVIQKSGSYQSDLDFSITPILYKALKFLNKKQESLKGVLEIKGDIPFGAGVGASASLCVGIAYLFLYKKWLKRNQVKSFASHLEDFFHGKSSGMDITSVIHKKPILYYKGTLKNLNSFKEKPLLFLSYSGGRSATSVGVSKVRKLFDRNWNLAESIDKQMCQSVNLCLKALKERHAKKSLSLLSQALDLGEDCFNKWGLISYELEQHIKELKKKGALSTKPTGSGLGGHVISLWTIPPPSSLKEKLIPLTL